jgi:hypothetical protein
LASRAAVYASRCDGGGRRWDGAASVAPIGDVLPAQPVRSHVPHGDQHALLTGDLLVLGPVEGGQFVVERDHCVDG